MEGQVVSREELYEMVWSVPMVKVAEKFTVSGTNQSVNTCRGVAMRQVEVELAIAISHPGAS